MGINFLREWFFLYYTLVYEGKYWYDGHETPVQNYIFRKCKQRTHDINNYYVLEKNHITPHKTSRAIPNLMSN